MPDVNNYQWKSAEAGKLYGEGALASTKGWNEVELYGHSKLPDALPEFDRAVARLEKALELEGETEFPLLYKELARAYAGLALYSQHVEQDLTLSKNRADKSVAFGQKALLRFDRFEGWTLQSRADLHVALAIAQVCRHDIGAAEKQLSEAKKWGDLGNVGALWLAKIPQLKKKLGTKPKDKRCFIATAACGSADAAEVEQLRRFRDRVLLATGAGSRLVECYYRVSPPVARLVARSPVLRRLVRGAVVRPAAVLARLHDPQRRG